ncbi:Acylamidase [Methylobacterium crusticola]|uniref:Indoleacetamide hydrolase n=1 Tax=Methylobacterium crusticola TaxID=1697972 RepID=A0ABQ4R232_9HYPH|nr:amidase [Methylobacterium crusticola]GJD50901.1 Acylamidase [Methylobacterium crusticola]
MVARNLTAADATELAALVRSREVSPVEVVQAHLDRVAAVNPRLNAVVTLAAEQALAAARHAEAAVMAGAGLGPLHGVPFTVKDSLDTADVPTLRGSPLFAGRVPRTDATSVARMKRAGAILLAKTNLPEFAFWTETDNLLTGRTNNPWDLARTPGGSSGGESAAIAAGMSPIGIGSDVAISVRGPSAHTGIAALKPTHGRIPATGHWPEVPRRFWNIGPMARSVRDVALGYAIMAGPDGIDGYAASPGDLDAGLGPDPARQVRVGVMTEPGFGPVAAEVAGTVEAAAHALRDLGCAVEPVRIPVLEASDGVALSAALFGAEIKPEFQRVAADRPGPLFWTGEAVLGRPDVAADAYVRAHQAVERLKDAMAAYFARHDVLLCPVTPIPAPPHGLPEFVIDGRTVPARHILSATVPFNLTGLPAMTVRFGTSREGLPIGVQLVSRAFAESTILGLAARLEAVRGIEDVHPPL